MSAQRGRGNAAGRQQSNEQRAWQRNNGQLSPIAESSRTSPTNVEGTQQQPHRSSYLGYRFWGTPLPNPQVVSRPLPEVPVQPAPELPNIPRMVPLEIPHKQSFPQQAPESPILPPEHPFFTSPERAAGYPASPAEPPPLNLPLRAHPFELSPPTSPDLLPQSTSKASPHSPTKPSRQLSPQPPSPTPTSQTLSISHAPLPLPSRPRRHSVPPPSTRSPNAEVLQPIRRQSASPSPEPIIEPSEKIDKGKGKAVDQDPNPEENVEPVDYDSDASDTTIKYCGSQFPPYEFSGRRVPKNGSPSRRSPSPKKHNSATMQSPQISTQGEENLRSTSRSLTPKRGAHISPPGDSPISKSAAQNIPQTNIPISSFSASESPGTAHAVHSSSTPQSSTQKPALQQQEAVRERAQNTLESARRRLVAQTSLQKKQQTVREMMLLKHIEELKADVDYWKAFANFEYIDGIDPTLSLDDSDGECEGLIVTESRELPGPQIEHQSPETSGLSHTIPNPQTEGQSEGISGSSQTPQRDSELRPVFHSREDLELRQRAGEQLASTDVPQSPRTSNSQCSLQGSQNVTQNSYEVPRSPKSTQSTQVCSESSPSLTTNSQSPKVRDTSGVSLSHSYRNQGTGTQRNRTSKQTTQGRSDSRNVAEGDAGRERTNRPQDDAGEDGRESPSPGEETYPAYHPDDLPEMSKHARHFVTLELDASRQATRGFAVIPGIVGRFAARALIRKLLYRLQEFGPIRGYRHVHIGEKCCVNFEYVKPVDLCKAIRASPVVVDGIQIRLGMKYFEGERIKGPRYKWQPARILHPESSDGERHQGLDAIEYWHLIRQYTKDAMMNVAGIQLSKKGRKRDSRGGRSPKAPKSPSNRQSHPQDSHSTASSRHSSDTDSSSGPPGDTPGTRGTETTGTQAAPSDSNIAGLNTVNTDAGGTVAPSTDAPSTASLNSKKMAILYSFLSHPFTSSRTSIQSNGSTNTREQPPGTPNTGNTNEHPGSNLGSTLQADGGSSIPEIPANFHREPTYERDNGLLTPPDTTPSSSSDVHSFATQPPHPGDQFQDQTGDQTGDQNQEQRGDQSGDHNQNQTSERIQDQSGSDEPIHVDSTASPASNRGPPPEYITYPPNPRPRPWPEIPPTSTRRPSRRRRTRDWMRRVLTTVRRSFSQASDILGTIDALGAFME